MTRRLGLHAALFSLAPLVHAQAPAAPSVEWIRAHTIPFSTSEAGNGFDDLAGLEKVIGDARIVALGEPTHGTREAFQMKHRLLEYLVERHGFSIFSIEANMPEADALDAYVNGGEGDPRQLIAGYGWTSDTEEFLAMVEWMRAWNAAHPERPRLRYTGFDMQTPTVAARIAAQFLRKHAPQMEQSAVLLEDLPARGEVSYFTTATGEFPVEVARGKELAVSVWIRTEIPHGWAGLWWRCDTPRGTGAFDNMQSRGITGIREWTRYETRLTIDDDVQNINFGCVVQGEGTAWFDDIEITLDGKPFVDPTFGFGFEEGTGTFVLPQRTPRGAGCVVRTVDTRPHGGKRCLEIQRKPEPDTGLVKDAEGVLADMLAHRDEFARMTSAREANWAIQNARIVAQWARMTCAEHPSNLKSGVRDECMAENVAWILEQNPGARAVLWAHNGHVSRSPAYSEFRDFAPDQGLSPMGGHLGRRFPDQMVVFGFSTGRGTYTALAPRGIFDVRSDNPLQPPPEDSIESYLASARLPRFLLDIRAARDAPSASWAIVPHPMRHIGARAIDQQFYPCVVRDAFDVLVWQAETTASVPIRRGAGPLPGQDEREVKSVEKQERLIELRWRRDAQGNFEYAVAAEKDPEWQPWFSEGFARALGVIGAWGPLALLGHSGDVLSLTDGERHLQRLGVSLTTGDLAAFVHTPLPEAARDVALLDRMVAIDVLRARSDADAKVSVTQLGADATLPKGLRERASATVARLALDPAKWPLPAAADAFVVVRQAKMPSARSLLELGRFSCLAASAKVLTLLKAPTPEDFVHGETASEVCAEIPFEIARHLGNYRLDETGFTISLHEDGTSPEWTMCGVGHFDTAAVGATAPELGIKFDLLSDTTIHVRSQGLAVASRPDFSKQLLANGDAAVLVHVPKGSSLVAYGEKFGVPGIVHADLAVTLREADVFFDLRLGAADAAAAKTLADAIKKKLSELGWPGFLHNFAIEVDESVLRVEPDAEIVRVTFPLRRAAFPSLERAKQQLLKQWRK